jgi:pre-mRNA-splicing factor CWC26
VLYFTLELHKSERIMDPLQHDDIIKKKYLARGPGDAATKAYIASKYLGGGGGEDEQKKKKKKKKASSSVDTRFQKKRIGNIGIIDEEDFGWETAADTQQEKLKARQEQERLEQEAIQNAGGVFRGNTSNWQTIQEGADESDEEPVIVKEPEGPRMSNGQRAGVLTKAEIKAEAQRAREVEQRALERLKMESQGQDTDTVYRDASGRKIDPKMKRQEEARLRKEQIEKEARQMEWGKGLVQRKEAEEQKKRLAEEKDKPLAR